MNLTGNSLTEVMFDFSHISFLNPLFHVVPIPSAYSSPYSLLILSTVLNTDYCVKCTKVGKFNSDDSFI